MAFLARLLFLVVLAALSSADASAATPGQRVLNGQQVDATSKMGEYVQRQYVNGSFIASPREKGH